MLLPILTLITIFMVTACSSQRSALTDELATQTHTLPFALNESCELGSIIVLDPNGIATMHSRKRNTPRESAHGGSAQSTA
jgi:hypothetical protein